MRTYELIERWSPAERRLGAQRWGVPLSSPRVMADWLQRPRDAQRLLKRASDAGAEQLATLLAEFGGSRVPLLPALQDEADRLTGWYPFEGDDDGWCLPPGLAAAQVASHETHRFFAASLVGRLSDADLRLLRDEFELPRGGTRSGWVESILERICGDETFDADACEATADIDTVPASDVLEVRYVAGSGGHRFVVVLDGEEMEVAPREHAERAGHTFEPVEVDKAAAPRARRPAAVRAPTFVRAGAVVTFPTARQADDALEDPEFRDVALHRLDERRVATVEGCSAAEASRLLGEAGLTVRVQGG